MKRLFLSVFLIVLFAGLLLWSESRKGILAGAEASLGGWIASAGDGNGMLIPTLVFQGGVTGEELSALDIGLFVRAATRLGARVVGVVAYQFPFSQISLEVTPAPKTKFVAGSLLMERAASAGLPPEFLRGLSVDAWQPETFVGNFSTFFSGRGWKGGFLNLPVADSGIAGLPVFARLGDEMVSSFALSCYLAAHSDLKLQEIVGDPERGLILGAQCLPVSSTGRLPMDVSLIRQVRRLDMDDLLLEVERMEHGRSPNPKTVALIRNQIVLLGTLQTEDAENFRLDSGRQLSLVEYQGMAIAGLQHALRPRFVAWWMDLLVLLAVCGFALALWRIQLSAVVPIGIIAVAFWLLLTQAWVQQHGILLPLIFPILLILLAILLRIFLHNHGETDIAKKDIKL